MYSQIVDSLTHVQRKRLAYIDFRLYFFGDIDLAELTQRFNIVPAEALQSFALYREIAPQNIKSAGNNKGYRIGKQFKPIFAHPPQSLLSLLTQEMGHEQEREQVTLLSCQSPVVFNRSNMDWLAMISRTMHTKRSLAVRLCQTAGPVFKHSYFSDC